LYTKSGCAGHSCGKHVEIPDRLIDTKSNLSSVQLKRMLYVLGLSYPVVEQHRGNIDMLLGVRNAIAHGDVLKVPTDRDVQNYTSAAFEVMRFVQHEIYNALREERYRRAPGDDPTEAGDPPTRVGPPPRASLTF
jgi:hypothetical protein